MPSSEAMSVLNGLKRFMERFTVVRIPHFNCGYGKQRIIQQLSRS